VAISDTAFIISKQGLPPEDGARMIKEICLIDRGLAWQPDIKRMPEFRDTLEEIESLL
jgi:polar amino acid transport system ATP-binding protein/sulfate transport system ATP-binding protein/NitT/TauT family transport system ATP-binding protein